MKKLLIITITIATLIMACKKENFSNETSFENFKSTTIDTPYRYADTPYMNKRFIDTPYVSLNNIDTPYISLKTIDTPYISLKTLDTPYIVFKNIDTPYKMMTIK